MTEPNGETYIHMVVHGEAKVGKTTFGTSGPGKTLVLDAEAGGMRFVPGKKITWNVDGGEPVPEDGDWKICRVPVTGLGTLQRVRDTLLSGKHPFNNLTVDSLTEIQDMVKRERSSTFQLQQQDWGYVFGTMNDVVVAFRDIVSRDPQLVSLVVVCGTQFKDGLFRPMISGQFGGKLPYKLDAIAYMLTAPNDAGELQRGLVLSGSKSYEVGHRLGPRAPQVLWNPTVTSLLNTVFETNFKEN